MTDKQFCRYIWWNIWWNIIFKNYSIVFKLRMGWKCPERSLYSRGGLGELGHFLHFDTICFSYLSYYTVFLWFCKVHTMPKNLNFILFYMHYAAWGKNAIKKRCSPDPTFPRSGETWSMFGETWAMTGRVGSHRVCRYRYVKIDRTQE